MYLPLVGGGRSRHLMKVGGAHAMELTNPALTPYTFSLALLQNSPTSISSPVLPLIPCIKHSFHIRSASPTSSLHCTTPCYFYIALYQSLPLHNYTIIDFSPLSWVFSSLILYCPPSPIHPPPHPSSIPFPIPLCSIPFPIPLCSLPLINLSLHFPLSVTYWVWTRTLPSFLSRVGTSSPSPRVCPPLNQQGNLSNRKLRRIETCP